MKETSQEEKDKKLWDNVEEYAEKPFVDALLAGASPNAYKDEASQKSLSVMGGIAFDVVCRRECLFCVCVCVRARALFTEKERERAGGLSM